jgi:hypothetical protein
MHAQYRRRATQLDRVSNAALHNWVRSRLAVSVRLQLSMQTTNGMTPQTVGPGTETRAVLRPGSAKSIRVAISVTLNNAEPAPFLTTVCPM